MFTVRSLSLATSVLLLSCIACDRSQPVEPAVEAASTGATGPTVKAPSNTNAIAVSESRIDVSWQDNSTNETGFEVHRSASGPNGTFTLRAFTGANITSYHDTGLEPLTQYCYEVRAFRTFDGKTSYSQFSTAACATTPAPPAPTAPSGTDAKPATSILVAVSWIDNATTEDGFRLERSLDLGSTWALVGTVGPNVTSLSDDGRVSEQQVCYRVIAFNRGGDSPPSNTDCIAPPSGPSNLTAAAAANQGIDLTWTDNSAVEDGYEVQRSEDGVTFSTIANLAANSTSYHDGGATNTTATYWYRVRGKKDGGFSDFSNVASAQPNCVPSEPVETHCANNVDDDCDGLVDVPADPDCPQQDCGAFECSSEYVCGPNGICVPHCFDGALNGDEGYVDCGGSCDAKCQNGQSCNVNFDCASGKCVGSICQP